LSESRGGSVGAIFYAPYRMSGLQADGFFVVSQQIGRIAIDRDASARLELAPRKASGQHSDSPDDPRTLRRDGVIGSIANHDGILRRQLAGAQKSDLDERGVRLIVLHVISACDGIDEIAYVRQREVTVKLVRRFVATAISCRPRFTVAAQIPGGALADAARWKRGLAACGFGLIAASALILALRPSFSFVFVAEILHGMSAGLVGPAIAAISLGIAGRHGMSSRIGRNYRFAGAGNAVTAAFMGALGAYLSNNAIFIAAALLCIPALIALSEIRASEIDYARARNATKRDHTLDLQRLIDFTKNWRLVIFASALVAVDTHEPVADP
jgi:hypothetical protein